jgi:hypothetical protein
MVGSVVFIALLGVGIFIRCFLTSAFRREDPAWKPLGNEVAEPLRSATPWRFRVSVVRSACHVSLSHNVGNQLQQRRYHNT